MKEQYFECPYCLEEISIEVDLSAGKQEYIEDCELCCNPIQIEYSAVSGELIYFYVSQIQ